LLIAEYGIKIITKYRNVGERKGKLNRVHEEGLRRKPE
jgi:hypothetical protein